VEAVGREGGLEAAEADGVEGSSRVGHGWVGDSHGSAEWGSLMQGLVIALEKGSKKGEPKIMAGSQW